MPKKVANKTEETSVAKAPRRAAATKTIKKSPAKEKVAKAKKDVVTKDAKNSRKTAKDVDGHKYLDLGLLLDCTSSMSSWIERAKQTLIEIIGNVKASCEGKLIVRVSFIGYRDHCDRQRFTIKGFTEDILDVKNFIAKTRAEGGGDWPEDVVGGMRKCLDQDWLLDSKKQVFHIFDAPCHGNKYHSGFGDSYPKGSPEGLELEPLMREFASKKIGYTCVKLNEDCNKMIDIMKENHSELTVTDLAKASQTKTAAEVTKMFVDSASFILRATVGGKATRSNAAERKAVSGGDPLWDAKQMKVGQNFSCISYLRVDKIDGDKITVKNQLGGAWFISKDLLVRDMWSADHFDKEVKVTMTDLSEIIQSCRDTIFTVSFKKKIDAKQVEAKLLSSTYADLSVDAKMKEFSKQLVEGEACTLTGHLIDCDNFLGRSHMIDLNAAAPNNVRQVDHRTIDYIIFKNVKYVLGRKPAGFAEDLPLKVDRSAPRWDVAKLAVGNWFSQITYYNLLEIVDKDTVKVKTSQNDQELILSKDILLTEMQNGSAFNTTEKISRTEMVEKLLNAKESVMSIKYHKKVDDKFVREVLAEQITSAKNMKDAALIKAVSKQLVEGKTDEMVCALTGSDSKLGRSSIIDLNHPAGANFRLVDHRTLEELIINNTKYLLKK